MMQDDASASTDPNVRADAMIAAARQGQIRRLLMRLLAILAEELVRAKKEPDTRV